MKFLGNNFTLFKRFCEKDYRWKGKEYFFRRNNKIFEGRELFYRFFYI